MDSPAERLWSIQLRLERKGIDASGRMVRIPGERPDPIPVCAVTRFDHAYRWTFSRTASPELIRDLRQRDPEELFTSTPAVNELANAHGLRRQVCRTYHFDRVDRTGATGRIVRTDSETFASVVDGQEVSWATSSRSDDRSAELWVHTRAEQQRHGHATQVAMCWADSVLESGRIAFYSHLADNDASRRLAAKLGVVHLFEIASLIDLDQVAHTREST